MVWVLHIAFTFSVVTAKYTFLFIIMKKNATTTGINHVSAHFVSNQFVLSCIVEEGIILLTVHLSFPFSIFSTRTHTNLCWACCLFYSPTHTAKILFAFIEFKGRFSWHCWKLNLKSNKGFFSLSLCYPKQYVFLHSTKTKLQQKGTSCG